MNVYISGKMTGCKNYKRNFRAAEFKAREKLNKKYCVDVKIINPLNLSKEVESVCVSPTYADYLKLDIYYLMNCDVVYFMRNWIFSKGARAEHHIARVLGKVLIYE